MVLLACAVVALVGAGAEAAISSAGLFAYSHSQLGLVPIWLPMLYLHVALAARELSRWVFSEALEAR